MFPPFQLRLISSTSCAGEPTIRPVAKLPERSAGGGGKPPLPLTFARHRRRGYRTERRDEHRRPIRRASVAACPRRAEGSWRCWRATRPGCQAVTCTMARAVPDVVGLAATEQFCPRRAVAMKAWLLVDRRRRHAARRGEERAGDTRRPDCPYDRHDVTLSAGGSPPDPVQRAATTGSRPTWHSAASAAAGTTCSWRGVVLALTGSAWCRRAQRQRTHAAALKLTNAPMAISRPSPPEPCI